MTEPKMTWKMMLIELVGWWILGVCWGMFATMVLGLTVPWPTIILMSSYLLWSGSKLGKKSRDWLFYRLHGKAWREKS